MAEAALSNHAAMIGEIVTEATTAALNAALSERGIAADWIVAVLPLAAEGLITVASPKFRVLYRLH